MKIAIALIHLTENLKPILRGLKGRTSAENYKKINKLLSIATKNNIPIYNHMLYGRTTTGDIYPSNVIHEITKDRNIKFKKEFLQTSDSYIETPIFVPENKDLIIPCGFEISACFKRYTNNLEAKKINYLTAEELVFYRQTPNLQYQYDQKRAINHYLENNKFKSINEIFKILEKAS